ncbi:MAG: serine hydrolase [Caulobacter sp.]|nr:serine hydrolase [Caulobacter sp.]
MDDAITASLKGHVEAGNIVGAATRVWRDGALVHSANLGLRDPDQRLPVEPGTIYRIASMSKPVTALAALILMEAGRFALADPITVIAPEFADTRVLRSSTGPLDETDPAIRQITFEDLLTHRSGLTYGDFQPGPIAAAYRDALGGDLDSHVAPDDWIAGLARLPLIAQPGAAFNYSASSDLLGLLLARMEGVSLGEVLRRTIFDPLGMKDTGFNVPAEKLSRRAANCGFDASGKSISLAAPPGGAALAERPDDMAFESGGQGLWSTADDYLKFARLFVGGGSVDGVRLLSEQTMALMMTNHLDDAQRASGSMFGMPLFSAHGFSLGLAVVTDADQAAVTRCKGGVGTVGWPGAYGGWWQADPTNGAVMVFLTHNMMELDQLMMGVGLGVYLAITDFHALASEALVPAT